MNRRFIIIIISILWLQCTIVNSQIDTVFQKQDISFTEYLKMVSSQNLEYAAEKFNVNISEAAIEVAKIIPDPHISLDYSEDREGGSRTGYGYSSELGMTVEIGKRKARVNLAQSEAELSKLILADYFRNLQAEATLIYLQALKQKQLFKVGASSYKTMKQLSKADSIRFSLGSIMQIDAIQTKLEAGILFNDLILAVTEWKNSLSEITLMTGLSASVNLLNPVSHLHDTKRLFSLEDLITSAQNNRADLMAAILEKEVSQKSLLLARRDRNADIDLWIGASKGYLLNTPSPSVNGLTSGIAIPLKFSNFSRGEIKMAQARISQSEEAYKLVEAQIKTEIIQAWNLYYVYCNQVENFDSGLLEMASDVIKGKIYSYQRGMTSLLEVLNAQRTYNDIQTAYYDARFNRAAALVNLEKSAGIWDISF